MEIHALPSALSSAEMLTKKALTSRPPNTIILTSGLTGSSVLTGLIKESGFWTGDTTFKKEYDTHENSELIGLNRRLLQESGYTGNYAMEFSKEAIDLVTSLGGRIDERPYRDFLQKCDARRPWVWKDPRLWLTIRIWARFLPLNDCRFIVLTRDPIRAWVSSILRRHIRSLASVKRYEASIESAILAFLRAEGLTHLPLTYEKLITRPERVIAELNSFLGTHLSVEDLRRVYQGRLYETPRSSALDYLKATLIYWKNYSQRADIREGMSRGG